MKSGYTVVLAILLLLVLCAAAYGTPKSLYAKDEAIPSDAIVLFDGKDLSQWVRVRSDEPASWKIQDGYAIGIGGSIQTKQEFKDFQLHMEFWLPVVTDMTGQFKANSGVFMSGTYEVQILDSYGLEASSVDCGAIYSITPPTVNACRPPEQWQSFDIFFRAPRFDENGAKTADARISVIHNGVWIHHDAPIPNPTVNHSYPCVASGPIEIQDHGNNQALRFRNIWIRPL